MRKVFLDELPKYIKGNHKGCVDWDKCIGYTIRFTYEEIEDEVTIINSLEQYLYIKYKDYDDFKIQKTSFTRANIGKLIKYDFRKYYLHVGDKLISDTRNLLLTDQKIKLRKDGYNQEWFKYTCYKCGWKEGWMEKHKLLRGDNCACCSGSVVVEEINSVYVKAPWMIKHFQNPNDAKKYTCGSNKKIYPICFDCGRVKDKPMAIARIYSDHTIYCTCSDKISYPEKFIISMLNQLNLKYIYQLTKASATWINSGIRYDFSINDKSCVIEVNGIQHYNDKFSKLTGISIEEQTLIDLKKEQLAKTNGIKHYIILDCRKSELEWIKKSVLESELPTLFNFTEDDIDWLKCHEYALSNLVKEVCDYKNSHCEISINELAEIFKIGTQAIRSYLKNGTLLNWCNYNPKDERLKAVRNLKPSAYKKVEVYKNNISVGTFNSLKELVETSFEIFNVQFIQTCISSVCHGYQKSHLGYTFKLI